MRQMLWLLAVFVNILTIGTAWAQSSSLFQETGEGSNPLFSQGDIPVLTAPSGPLLLPKSAEVQGQGASLFAGRIGVLAPPPLRLPAVPEPVYRPPTTPAAQLKDLIARAEAGSRGYDAVQYGARIKTPKPPTQMTIAEIYRWIDDTPGQPHAIGRYQFIPPTLRRLVRQEGVALEARFSPAVQDQLASRLLREAGIDKFRKGDIGRIAFMNNLAKIWAGLPNSTGKSHYHGYAGNKATMTWSHFDREMRRIFGDA